MNITQIIFTIDLFSCYSDSNNHIHNKDRHNIVDHKQFQKDWHSAASSRLLYSTKTEIEPLLIAIPSQHVSSSESLQRTLHRL